MSAAIVIERQVLTAREVDILQQLADGESTEEVRRQLQISMGTLKNYMRLVYAKLGADNRTHAVAVAMRRGIIR